MESWMRLGCRCTSWSLRQTIACGRAAPCATCGVPVFRLDLSSGCATGCTSARPSGPSWRWLSLVELVRYGCLLCSRYAYDGDKRGFRKRTPLTDVRSLRRFVEKSRGCIGSNKALRALRFIADSSASPMETNLVMALCLSRMIGGYGLDLPELNACIEVRTKGLVQRERFECDLYWRKRHVAVEYDSGEHHSGNAAETRDSARRSALISQGVTVVSITPDQFFDARKFDESARAVAKLTGKRLPPNDASWMMKRYRLRKELLQDMRQGKPA